MEMFIVSKKLEKYSKSWREKVFLQSDDDLPQRFFLGRSGTGTSSLIIDRLLDA